MAETIHTNRIQKQQVNPVHNNAAAARVRPERRTPPIPTIDISNFSEESWKNAHNYTPAAKGPQFHAEPAKAYTQAARPEQVKPEASPLQDLRLYSEAIANVASGKADVAQSPSIRVTARIHNGAELGAAAEPRQATAAAQAANPANANKATPAGTAEAKEAEAEKAGVGPKAANGAEKGKGPLSEPKAGCDTCASRRYQDGSHDAGVSFQSPKGMPASTAGRFVASHEGEHVSRETAKAREEGKIVTQKKVTMEMGFCPDCNRLYAKGGKTTIQTQSAASSKNNAGSAVVTKMQDILRGNGEKFNLNL